jgi:hypothetical protein
MPKMKPAKAPKTTADAKQFSLVSAAAQQEMYKALATLKSARPGPASGAEVAEIAVCVALGENDPVILACPARGARTVRRGNKAVGSNGNRLAAATISAVAALLADSKATALVCAGKFDAQVKAQEDYRNAFSFAARHKLPILFLVANTLTPIGRKEMDLRTLYEEFGIPVFSVDGNDAIAAYRVATEALHNARHLRGPCVIEALKLSGSAVTPLALLRGYMERHGNQPL